MPASDTLVRQKTPCSRVRAPRIAPRIAARPGRGGASGASFMPDSKTTGDRYAMRPIDVELYETCAKGTLAQVRALLDKGADPNAIHWIESWVTQDRKEYCGDCDFPVIQAATNKDPRVLELLLSHGARPNVTDGLLRQPLAFAAGADRYRNVARLLEVGNDPNFVGVDGDTPCSWAANNKTTRVLKLLLAHGADPNIGGIGDMALEQAVKHGTPARVRFLVTHGASPQTCHETAICLAPVENVKALLECGYDPNTIGDAWDNSSMPMVDILDGAKRALFLAFGAVSAFHHIRKGPSMYGTFFFRSNDELFRYVSKNGPSWPVLREYRGCKTPTILGRLDDTVSILVSTVRDKKRIVANETHILLCETRQACRKDFCRVTPFFKPKKGFLWHASLDYGEARIPLDFVVANAIQGDAFDLCAKGGVFEMRFMGLGESIKCMNNQGVVRFWDGLPVARERRDKGDPSIDHVDMVFSEARSLNPCHDKENPAFAEFTSTIENVAAETICGQPCYRIRLWSGPLEDPASFPWTLLIAKSRIAKGWIPRVGDFVNGIAAMYGTFDDKAEKGAEPTVYQPEFLSGDSIPEPPIPKKDIPKPPKGKPETEWLPRRPKDYPDAPAPRVPLPAFTDEPFKKFVTYPEYRRHIGKDLVPVALPSRKRLREIVDAIDHVITTDGNRRVFAPHFDAIGVRHAVRDPTTGETHLWFCMPWYSRWCERHGDLLVALSPDGRTIRYTVHTGDERWAHGEWESFTCGFKKGSKRTDFATPNAALKAVPAMKKDDFIVLSGKCHGSMLQAACSRGGKRRSFLVEIQILGLEWQFSRRTFPKSDFSNSADSSLPAVSRPSRTKNRGSRFG